MIARARGIVLALASGSALACSAILDFEPETPQCWCGESWQSQVSGARAYDTLGNFTPIAQSDTNYSLCVSQSQHVALNEGDAALTNALAAGSIAQCELAAVELLAGTLDYTYG